MIKQFFLRDNLLLGIILGMLIPAAIYGFLYVIIFFIIPSVMNVSEPIIKNSTVQLISIFTNVFPLRYYLLRLKFDLTGRGILLVTLIMTIVFFVIHIYVIK